MKMRMTAMSEGSQLKRLRKGSGMFRDVPGCSGVFRGVPVFRCSGVPGFSTCLPSPSRYEIRQSRPIPLVPVFKSRDSVAKARFQR